jgi:putative tryptophan/tyrosine transport system substrate-binding protein
MTSELTSKKLALFKEMVPHLSRVAFLHTPKEPGPVLGLKQAEESAAALGMEIVAIAVPTLAEMPRAFQDIENGRFDGIFVYPDWVMSRRRAQIIQFVAEHGIPAMYGFREWVQAGGLMAYGTGTPGLSSRAAGQVDRILKGASPSDLPVEQASRFELVLNLRTAQSLGLTVPPSLLARADEVIE